MSVYVDANCRCGHHCNHHKSYPDNRQCEQCDCHHFTETAPDAPKWLDAPTDGFWWRKPLVGNPVLCNVRTGQFQDMGSTGWSTVCVAAEHSKWLPVAKPATPPPPLPKSKTVTISVRVRGARGCLLVDGKEFLEHDYPSKEHAIKTLRDKFGVEPEVSE